MNKASTPSAKAALVLVTLRVAGQLCGIPVSGVRDILGEQAITPVPLAPPEVAGSLTLRGRIVTAIDLRRRLGLAASKPGCPRMAVVNEQGHELYAVLVDEVLEVLTLDGDRIEPAPPTLPSNWTRFSHGVCRLDDTLMIVIDIDRLLAISPDHAV